MKKKAWLAAALALGMASFAARAQSGGEALRALYGRLQPALQQSPFERPLLLESSPSSSEPSGRVLAVIDHPYAAVAAALQEPGNWCDILVLPFNVKRCLLLGEGPRPTLRLAVGRKGDQKVEDAYLVDFEFRADAGDPALLRVQMSASEGPLGTSRYRLVLEATPLDGGRTFIRLSYAYVNGLAARLATDAYLATAGRSKVGFSVVGREDDGRAVLAGGVRGASERNTMRYFLAVEAFLDAQAVPESERAEKRLRDWFAASERYARQLHEMSADEYMTMKRRELAQQASAARTARAGS